MMMINHDTTTAGRSANANAIPRNSSANRSTTITVATTNTIEMATCYSSRNMQSKLIPVIGAMSPPPLPSSSSASLSSSTPLGGGALQSDAPATPMRTMAATTMTTTTLHRMRSTVAVAASTAAVKAAVDVRWLMRNGCSRWSLLLLCCCSLFGKRLGSHELHGVKLIALTHTHEHTHTPTQIVHITKSTAPPSSSDLHPIPPPTPSSPPTSTTSTRVPNRPNPIASENPSRSHLLRPGAGLCQAAGERDHCPGSRRHVHVRREQPGRL